MVLLLEVTAVLKSPLNPIVVILNCIVSLACRHACEQLLKARALLTEAGTDVKTEP